MAAPVPYPLDPLSAQEIRAAAAAVRRDRATSDGWRFSTIDLHEPSKQELEAQPAPQRIADIAGFDRADGRAFKGTMSLAEDRVTSWEQLEPGQHPSMTVADYHEADVALRRNPRMIEALARRGITDMDLVLIDVWAYGAAVAPPRYAGRRIGWADVLGIAAPGRQPVRERARRAASGRRPQHDGAARARGRPARLMCPR